MNINSNFIKHITQTTCLEMTQICAPLQKVGIHLFMFMRIYTDTKGFALSSDPAWHQFYLTNFYQLRYPSSIQFASQIQDKIFITRELYPDIEEIIDASEFYGFGNAIGLVKNFNHYKEFYYFAAHKQNIHIINYYLNNIEYLEYFISYFKDKAIKIILLADKTKLPLPKEYLAFAQKPNNFNTYHELNQNLLADLKSERVYFMDNKKEVYLTYKQLEIIKWVIEGKSAEEIGIILKLSKRTVEEHISNIKAKFNCYKVTQLAYKLGKLNLPII